MEEDIMKKLEEIESKMEELSKQIEDNCINLPTSILIERAIINYMIYKTLDGIFYKMNTDSPLI